MKGFFMIRRILPIFLLIVLVPSFALAAQFKSGDSVTVGSNETIPDDLYVGSGNITIDGTVEGDLLVGGGTVIISGTVKGDLNVAGGNIVMRGQILDDVRIAGGQIDVNGTIADDLLVAGGMITIGSNATIAGDVKAAGGQIDIAGKTGSIEVATDTLNIRDTAVINGNVRYWSEKNANIATAAQISGEVKKEAVPQGEGTPFGTVNPVLAALIGIFVTALFAWLLSYIFPNKIERILASSGKEVGSNLLWGFLTIIAVPALAILLCMTVIGVPAGIFILLAFPLLLALGWLVAVLMAGYAINLLLTKQPAAMWVYALAGAALLTIFGIIPFIGWLATMLFFLAGLGGLVRFDWEKYQKLRSTKEL